MPLSQALPFSQAPAAYSQQDLAADAVAMHACSQLRGPPYTQPFGSDASDGRDQPLHDGTGGGAGPHRTERMQQPTAGADPGTQHAGGPGPDMGGEKVRLQAAAASGAPGTAGSSRGKDVAVAAAGAGGGGGWAAERDAMSARLAALEAQCAAMAADARQAGAQRHGQDEEGSKVTELTQMCTKARLRPPHCVRACVRACLPTHTALGHLTTSISMYACMDGQGGMR